MAYAKVIEKYPQQMRDAILLVAQDEMQQVTFTAQTEGLAKSLCARFYALMAIATKQMKEAMRTGKMTQDLLEFAQACEVVIPRVEGVTVVLRNKIKDFGDNYQMNVGVAEGALPVMLQEETPKQAPVIPVRPPMPVSERAQTYGAKNVGMTKEQADALVAKAKGMLKE